VQVELSGQEYRDETLEEGYAGDTAPWLRRRQARSARPAGNSHRTDGTGEFTHESTLGVPRNRIPAADTHDIPHASNTHRGRTDAWTDRNRVLRYFATQEDGHVHWTGPTGRPAWTLRQTTGKPSGLHQGRGGHFGSDTRIADPSVTAGFIIRRTPGFRSCVAR
jgi:hypothetical protein